MGVAVESEVASLFILHLQLHHKTILPSAPSGGKSAVCSYGFSSVCCASTCTVNSRNDVWFHEIFRSVGSRPPPPPPPPRRPTGVDTQGTNLPPNRLLCLDSLSVSYERTNDGVTWCQQRKEETRNQQKEQRMRGREGGRRHQE